jgi:hypothetical protein
MARGSVFLIASSGSGAGTVILRDSANTQKDSVNVFAGQTVNYPLGDLEVEIEDTSGNPIGNINYLAYSTNTLNLGTLAQCAVIIGQNTNVTISSTAPISPSEGDVWLEPI